jgi:hypothetical protein
LDLAIAKFKDGSSRKILINTYGSSFRDGTGKPNHTLEENVDAGVSFKKITNHMLMAMSSRLISTAIGVFNLPVFKPYGSVTVAFWE